MPVEKQNHPYIYLTQDTIGQIWAEAYAMWQGGQQTHDVEIEKEAERQQIGHFLQDPRQAAIEEILGGRYLLTGISSIRITFGIPDETATNADLITRDRVECSGDMDRLFASGHFKNAEIRFKRACRNCQI